VAYDVREGAAESWFRETVAADGADLVIEAAGNPDAVGLALRMARPGGSVALIGAAGTDAAPCRLDSDVFVLNDLRVHGICGSVPAAWDLAIGLAATGRLSLGRLISHRYSVTEAAAAYRTVESRATGTMKVVLVHDWAAA
jgi:L-iditol 2-dehydrogenase